jgi:C1A family cysteine protease
MISFDDLNARLRASAATWTARQTPQFLLSDEQKAQLLGVVVNDADLASAIAPRAEAEAPNFAQVVDWRNRNGNHVTPVKDQARCGSCVSFCTVATVESMASIELRQQLNLSEADLHFCSDHGPNCGGWWPTNAYNVMKNRGVADEDCFPYPVDASRNVNSACASCADRDARAVKITESTTLSSVTERKNWLTNVGPCCAVIRVFDDFFAYGEGVYRHIMDNNPNTPDDVERGLHCVEIIGYSEAERCWIGKNSWGSAWGDQGFFKIGYGEIGIDTDFPFWTARGVIAPLATPLTVVEQHNLFRSADDHIHALWFNFSTGWHHEDRSTLLPNIPPAVGDPFGYAFIDKNSGLLEQHNLFRSADGHIHALWFNFATGWHHEDRSTFLPDIPPAVGDHFATLLAMAR